MSAHHDLNAQKSRIEALRQRLQLPWLTDSSEHKLDEIERTLRYLATIEEEPCSTLSRQLITSGITLPAPGTLTPAELHHKLWEVLRGLAHHRTFLYNTNHLSDFELYEELWENVLNEPAYELDESMGDCATHLDLLGDGSDPSILIHLKYYADESEREEWRGNFPDDPLPDHLDPPHDRDRLLPQRPTPSDVPAKGSAEVPYGAPQLNRARKFIAEGLYPHAHAELDELELSPDYDLGLRLQVATKRLELFLLQSRWKDATLPGELLCEFDPEEPDHFINYAHALDQLGQPEHALHVLSLAPEEIARLPVYHYNSACYEALCGETKLATRHLKRACKMDKQYLPLAKKEPALACLRLQLPQQNE